MTLALGPACGTGIFASVGCGRLDVADRGANAAPAHVDAFDAAGAFNPAEAISSVRVDPMSAAD
ncbi:MAG: hypothetical protein QOF70_2598 [Acetobacteraceae bacterium]|jgi:hypothetical protein|nr:hypothetical protein [Rhodopila sp.]MEA2728123.1 hypothetical protein [Acetobacteraceae bacterium]